MELIKISENAGQQVVSARELHEFLGATERFYSWATRNLKYGFIEGVDYSPLTSLHTQNKVEMQDYALTLDTSKQLAMMARSEKGLEARRYFIECEKKLKQPRTLTRKEMAYAVIEAEEAREAAEEAQRLAEAEAQKQKALVQELAPHASYACEVLDSSSSYTATQMAKELNMKSAEALNTKLAEMRVHFLSGDIWVLYAKYSDKGYQKRGQKTIIGKNGNTWQVPFNKWTEKGREFLHGLLNQNYKNSLKAIDE